MIKSTKTSKISAVFLAAVLTAGMIALSSPSFMTGAEAFPYNNYDNDYKHKFKKPIFDKSFGKSSAEFKKCVNINLNFPGLDFSPSFGADPGTLAAESLARDGGNSGPNGGHDGFKKFDKDGFVCINANDNSVRGGIGDGDGDGNGDGNGPTQEECEACIIENLVSNINAFNNNLANNVGGPPELDDTPITSLTVLCQFLLANAPVDAADVQEVLEVGEPGQSGAVEDMLECLFGLGLITDPDLING